MGFQRAARRRAYLKMGISGPSGSGKTYGALQVAFGLAGPGGKIAVIDTENGSASLYAHLGEFDVLELAAPFTVARYRDAISEAVAGGYDVLVIDSISHEWAGEGGLLAYKESLDARGGNPFSNWAKITPQHEQFKSALLQAPLHVIVTLRSKQDYVLQDDGKGRTVPVKVGLTPIQREGFEYELSLVFDLSMSHDAMVGKDRTGLFDGFAGRLSADHGRRLREWLEAAPVAPNTADEVSAMRTAKMEFAREAQRLGYDVLGESGRFSTAKLLALLSTALDRSVTAEPPASDWREGTPALAEWAGRHVTGAPAVGDDAQADPAGGEDEPFEDTKLVVVEAEESGVTADHAPLWRRVASPRNGVG